MTYLMFCSDKKCHKEMAPVLETKSGKVYCTECGEEQANISHFQKTTLKTMSQIKRQADIVDSLSMECEKCKHQARPKIVKGKLVCEKCANVFVMSEVKAHGLKQILSTFTTGKKNDL